jgi:geranylgeranyl diphosphate synthase, type II
VNDLRQRIETALLLGIEALGPPGRLRDACAHAVLKGGKRLRPLLVLLIGEALAPQRCLMPIALSVEYFHTASLIADDLPCMDNDVSRRGVPALHIAFGESVALLASYTLIAAGYGGIYEMVRSLREAVSNIDMIAVLALETITRCAGLRGATQGQFLDLFPPDSSFETYRSIIGQKTVTLFEIAFVVGWLFGGGDQIALEEVKKCAAHFGVAFQIADDLQDLSQDQRGLLLSVGRDRIREVFESEVSHLEQSLKKLTLWTPPFQTLVDQLLCTCS